MLPACPSNCKACQWDTTQKKVVCTAGQCKPGYGLITDKTCAGESCPAYINPTVHFFPQ